jgi:hypothetical protein
MDRPDHIRNPIEWGFDQIRLAVLTVESLGRSVRGSQESRDAPLPTVRRIKAADLRDVLVKGLGDPGAYGGVKDIIDERISLPMPSRRPKFHYYPRLVGCREMDRGL